LGIEAAAPERGQGARNWAGGCPGEAIGLPARAAFRRDAIHMTFPNILFEDDFLIAFDKPSGLPVAPGRWEKAGASLMGLVRGRFGQSVSNVHRLDAEASGIVLCARTKASLDFLSGQFQSKTIRKAYCALVGVLAPERADRAASPARDASGALPAEFSVDLAIGEDADHPGRMRVCRGRGGRQSVTEFRVLESFGRFAWIECRPVTGRTHQVRVHLAAAGAPILCDALYGDPGSVLLLSGLKRRYKGRDAERPLISRLALHARSIGLVHPALRGPVEITSPIPREFEIALKYLRRFSGARSAPGRPG
jgi:23S rRNA pseudouridine1911/1915/1917 synthase